MGRAMGINASMALAFEATYGTSPASGYKKLPFISTTLSAEQGLIADDIIGTGRDPSAPSRDVINVNGDVVVPVDLLNFGNWLKLLLGAPTSVNATGTYTHTFGSNLQALPSAAIEIGNPEVPSYAMNKGVMANTLNIRMQRSGLVQATVGLIGQNEVVAATTGAGTPTEAAVTRFNQFQGSIKRDGTPLGNVVSADFTYSNNLEQVEVIRADGLIGGVDPGKASFTGSIVARFDSLDLFNLAVAGTASEIAFGFEIGASSKLTFTLPSVFLPRPKREISGPNGVQATFAIQASRAAAGTKMLTAALVNNVASY